MQTVMESMTDPVILTDPQHRVITQNKAAERYFRLPDDVSEGRVRAVELNNLLFSAALSSMAVSGNDSSRDMTLVDAIEGDEVLFEAVSAPSFAPDGRRTGMVTVLRDVTDLRRADEELRANYERLRAGRRGGTPGPRSPEPGHRKRRRSDRGVRSRRQGGAAGSAGQGTAGPGPRTARRCTSATRQSWTPTLRSSPILSPIARAAPIQLTHPATLQEVEYDARSGKIYDERGMVAYTVTVLRDLTAVRRLEQLRMERRMLEMEKFAAAGRLAGTIAHEVNNPMEAIKNCIFLLTDQIKSDAAPVYEILKSETERVARIVRQMLGLYRNTEQVGNFDVNSVVEDTLLLFSRQLERAGVRVETELNPLPPALGSADQIRQVLSNLVVNARDSMSKGGVLRVRTRRIRKDRLKDVIRIAIADTGCGISKPMLRTVFEPFVTTKGERGTGLGLWIVKGIIENHGGKLRVHSQCRTRHSVLHRVAGSAIRGGGCMKRKSRILVVDDEPNVLVTYRLILQQRGYEVSAALSSEEARATLAEHEIDLLLCDLSLEKQENGFDVIEVARLKNPQMPTVLLTGYATPEANERAEQMAIPVLFKPIDIKELLNTISQLLKENYEQQEAAG